MADTSVQLMRAPRRALQISLVPLIDVLLILLVFFMVTSTYLDLDVIPASETGGASPAARPESGPSIMVRIAADGIPVVQGRALVGTEFSNFLSERARQTPGTQVMILPSGAARTQALVSAMDQVAASGITRVRVIQLEADE